MAFFLPVSQFIFSFYLGGPSESILNSQENGLWELDGRLDSWFIELQTFPFLLKFFPSYSRQHFCGLFSGMEKVVCYYIEPEQGLGYIFTKLYLHTNLSYNPPNIFNLLHYALHRVLHIQELLKISIWELVFLYQNLFFNPLSPCG